MPLSNSVNPGRGKPFLTLEQATFRLGDRLVFSNTSWTWRAGEQWIVTGPNGSGKSIFADALSGRLPLVAGKMTYHFNPPRGLTHEEAIATVTFEERRCGFEDTLAQSRWHSAEEHQGLRVREALQFEHVYGINPFEVYPITRQARRAFARRCRRTIDWLDLRPLLEQRLIALSNGESQRWQLARALCRPLRLLILDEPLAGLDTAHRRDFLTVLKRLTNFSLRLLVLTNQPADFMPSRGMRRLVLENCRMKENSKLQNSKSRETPKFKIQTRRRPSKLHGGRREVVIEMRRIAVRYGKNIVLDGLDWTVCAGEGWALLGPNGSGKTTLLGLISGDHPRAYANDIMVFGRRLGPDESTWDRKRQIGWVSPELHLHFPGELSCLEAVVSGLRDSIGLYEEAMPLERRAALCWLRLFDLMPLANEPFSSASAGLQRMVLLARALVKRPRLLLLDEPCQGLDELHRRRFLETLNEVLSTGRETALYVTHRPEELPSAIQHVLRLGTGKAQYPTSNIH